MTHEQRERITKAVIKYGTAKIKYGQNPNDTTYKHSEDAFQSVIDTLFAVSDELEQEAAS